MQYRFPVYLLYASCCTRGHDATHLPYSEVVVRDTVLTIQNTSWSAATQFPFLAKVHWPLSEGEFCTRDLLDRSLAILLSRILLSIAGSVRTPFVFIVHFLPDFAISIREAGA